MKKIILSLLSLMTVLSITKSSTNVWADTDDVVYEDNAYQVCDIQSSLTNLFLGNSIYNSSIYTINLEGSIRIKNPTSKKLTFYFNFKEDISTYNIDPFGSFYFSLFKDDGSYLVSFAEQFRTVDELKGNLERDENITYSYSSNEIFIEFDTSSYPQYITFCGDEYLDSYDGFKVDFYNLPATIKKFMLFPGSKEDLVFSSPSIGIGKGSDQVYTNNDTISYTINYDNRLSLEEIKSQIVAYDYYDKSEIIPSVELDEYSDAVSQNKLGTFSVKLKATDKSANSTTINISLKIEDTTSPIIQGDNNITIHYTDLPSNNLVDLTQYIYAIDNYDGRVDLNDSYKNYSPIMFESQNINVSFTDTSGNTTSGKINLTITDTIAPTISGESSLTIFQYEYPSVDDIVELYNISDDGSGLKKTYYETNITDINRAGDYQLTIYAEDNSANIASLNVDLKIQDGVGPVFFINTSSLNLLNTEYQSADQVMAILMENGSVSPIKYKKCSYITKGYENNYNKVGSYDTQIVCYDENGNKDYYLVKINVTEPKNSNFFTRLFHSMTNFFKTLGEEFKSLFNKIVNFFKK